MSLLAGACFGISLRMLVDLATGEVSFFEDQNIDLHIALWLLLIGCALMIYMVST